uniref:Putative secreted protein n=1 Tax=Amblyomma triste TaxID=251400 RepID=A0A023FZY1_AMBTT
MNAIYVLCFALIIAMTLEGNRNHAAADESSDSASASCYLNCKPSACPPNTCLCSSGRGDTSTEKCLDKDTLHGQFTPATD